MPTPTLYDNFSRVKEWSIDKFADKESLSYYVTDSELNACGYLTSIPSEYITDSELSGCSYITMTDVSNCGYVTSSQLPVINESIVPKENNTYTLGDSSHIYKTTYQRYSYLGTGVRMYSESSASSNDLAIDFGGVSYFFMNNNRFAPNGAANNNVISLGADGRKWANVLSYNYWTGYNTKIHSSSNYNMVFTINTNNRYQLDSAAFVHFDNSKTSSLGTAAKPWAYTYTNNVILNGTNLEDRLHAIEVACGIANQ